MLINKYDYLIYLHINTEESGWTTEAEEYSFSELS